MSALRKLLTHTRSAAHRAFARLARTRGAEPDGDGVKTLIAPDLVLTGSMTSGGDVYVLGRVDGDVVCDRIFFAGNGVVEGKVQARQQISLNS